MKMFYKFFLETCCLLPACLAAAPMPALDFDPPPRVIKMDQKNAITLTGKNFEIVVPDDAGKPAKLAGKELQSFLSKVLSAKIPLHTTRTKEAAHAIILGDSALSRKTGIKVDTLGRDAFLMKTIGRDIYIAGRDDKSSDTEKLLADRNWLTEPFLHQRATIFGAYDFLERFADIRFYFYGPIGTLVPQKTSLKIPHLDIFDRPDNIVRRYKICRFRKDDWYLNEDPVRGGHIASLRMRAQTRDIPNCHGLARLGYVTRFGKTHPEFFALKNDGTRSNTWKDDFPGQICLTNPGFRDELFKDMVSGLKGEPPEKRGIVFSYKGNPQGFSVWSPSVLFYPGFFNIHIQDGCKPCLCAECQKYYKSTDSHNASGELIWEFTADMATRVKNAGINAYITQLAYDFYRNVPKTDLPDNVLVQVATAGPWASASISMDKSDRDLLSAWNKKLGRKVWLWNYILNGHDPASQYTSPGAPQYSPKAIGYYYQARRKMISGAFMSTMISKNDYIHEAMNIYMGMKILWDTSLNVEQLMAEYYDRMFLAAAPEMKKFFEELEALWIRKMRGQYIETSLGPVAVKPTEYEMWTQIYTSKKLAAWEKLFNIAEKKLEKEKDALARVRFMRSHFLDYLRAYAEKFRAKEKQANNLIAYAAPAGKERIYYFPRMHGKPSIIKPGVTIQNANDALLFQFRVNDTRMKELIFREKSKNLTEFFEGTSFEIFLNPTGDRKTVYQIAVSPGGEYKIFLHPGLHNIDDSGIQVKTKVSNDHWTADVRIPFASLPNLKRNGFPANFSYNCQLKNVKSHSELYSWSPWLLKRFLELDHYGQLSIENLPETNLVDCFDLQGLSRKGRIAGRGWSMSEKEGGQAGFTSEYYISGGQCLKGVGTSAKSIIQFAHAINGKLKSDTRYRFSYYIRYDMDDEAIVRGRVWAGRNYFFPPKGMKGKRDWTLVTGEFKTGKLTEYDRKNAHIGFGFNGKGIVFIDHLVLEEIK